MKRLFYKAGIILTLSFFGSCAQHDPNSPDTSGAVPNNQPGVGVDTVGAQSAGDSLTPNMNNDGSNVTKQSSTFDSVEKRQ